MSNRQLPIIMYHNIAVPPKQAKFRGLYVLPNSFKRQMLLLKLLGHRGISMSELLPYLRGEKQGKVVGITFDDGYADNLQYALPVLKQFGFTATCYIVADRIGKFNDWDYQTVKVEKQLMDADQIRLWLSAGMEIGSHTLTHPNLKDNSQQTIDAEIISSKYQLATYFNTEVNHFCYPYGFYDDRCYAAIKRAGYATAVTTKRGRVDIQTDDLLLLHRVLVARTTLLHLFLLKLFGRYEDKRKVTIQLRQTA